jgi:hypothetical protein
MNLSPALLTASDGMDVVRPESSGEVECAFIKNGDKIYMRVGSDHTDRKFEKYGIAASKGSLKNNFTFYTPMHPGCLRCESSEYPDIPAFSRLVRRAPQRLKL